MTVSVFFLILRLGQNEGNKRGSVVQIESVIFFYPGQVRKSKWTEGADEITVVRIRENILTDTSFMCLENDCCMCLSLQFWTIS